MVCLAGGKPIDKNVSGRMFRMIDRDVDASDGVEIVVEVAC